MPNIESDLDGLDSQISELEASIGAAQSVTGVFKAELETMQVSMSAAGRQAESLSRSVGTGLRRAFDGLVFDGMRLSDALKTLGQSMVNSAFNQAMRPVQNALGGLLTKGIGNLVGSILPFEKGGSFAGGKVTPFARGGVVSRATSFPMRGGVGLMGEAGPEAIMPLSRGADGSLGVRSQGGGRAVNVTMNISTPDADGFRRSRTQIAAQMNRAIARGSRNS